MKKIPKDPNWHYLKWLGIAIISILLFGIINNLDNMQFSLDPLPNATMIKIKD